MYTSSEFEICCKNCLILKKPPECYNVGIFPKFHTKCERESELFAWNCTKNVFGIQLREEIWKGSNLEMSIFFFIFWLQVFCSLIISECIILIQFFAICEGVDPLGLPRPLIIIIIYKMITNPCNIFWVDGGILTKNGGKTYASFASQFSLRVWGGYLHEPPKILHEPPKILQWFLKSLSLGEALGFNGYLCTSLAMEALHGFMISLHDV